MPSSRSAMAESVGKPARMSRGIRTNPGATGEGLQAAQHIGAGTCLMDWIQLGPWTSPDEKGFGVCPKFVEVSVGFGLMVDPKTAKRFINETGNRKVRADAILKIGHPAVVLVSEKNMKKHVPQSTVDAGLANGSIKRFETLDALATGYRMDAAELGRTVARRNEAIEKKTDPDFGAKIFKDTEPNTGVFYACRLWPRVHYCMGGLTINEKAEMFDTAFNVISGLFAAGEVCGGVHGMVRLGIVSIADCVGVRPCCGQERCGAPGLIQSAGRSSRPVTSAAFDSGEEDGGAHKRSSKLPGPRERTGKLFHKDRQGDAASEDDDRSPPGRPERTGKKRRRGSSRRAPHYFARSGNLFMMNFTRTPTNTAEMSVPSRSPTTCPRTAQPRSAAASESTTSLVTLTDPKGRRSVRESAITMPSPGCTIVLERICSTMPTARTTLPARLIASPGSQDAAE